MPITAYQLAKQVQTTRAMQKEYFKKRDVTLLAVCKKAEKDLDTMIESVINYQAPQMGNLFEKP